MMVKVFLSNLWLVQKCFMLASFFKLKLKTQIFSNISYRTCSQWLPYPSSGWVYNWTSWEKCTLHVLSRERESWAGGEGMRLGWVRVREEEKLNLCQFLKWGITECKRCFRELDLEVPKGLGCRQGCEAGGPHLWVRLRSHDQLLWVSGWWARRVTHGDEWKTVPGSEPLTVETGNS